MMWESVYVFISSTFNDMHAERDLLIKEVFPEVSEWCEQHRLRLVDIDLRWGVTEADANENKNTVKICMDRIDECRPFFLCFLGQRRGWVPSASDISEETISEYPAISDLVGKESVTEMEMLHALYAPFNKYGKPMQAVEHALFFLRDPGYLKDIPRTIPQLYNAYTNEGITDASERKLADEALAEWRRKASENKQAPCFSYSANWNNDDKTPELLLPLSPDSEDDEDIKSWEKLWEGINIPKDEYNREIGKGRLGDFRVQDRPLSEIIIFQLKKSIEERFPDHFSKAVCGDSGQQKQEEFMFAAMQGYSERTGDFEDLNEYAGNSNANLFALTASAGMGKSMLLAKWSYKQKNDGKIIFTRFAGAGITNANEIMRSLISEMSYLTGFSAPLTMDTREQFAQLLKSFSGKKQVLIVIDGLNQLDTGLSDMSWLPVSLPDSVKIIVSVKSGNDEGDTYIRSLKAQGAIISEVRPFNTKEEKQELANVYLTQYLKGLDQKHLDALADIEGSENPLFIKIILSELRSFGSFRTLMEKIKSDYGGTPQSAFARMLVRLESDPAYSPIPPKKVVPLVFSLLACSRQGLSVEQLGKAIEMACPIYTHKQCLQAVNLILRQIRQYILKGADRVDFLYESLQLAALDLYAAIVDEAHSLLARMFQTYADPSGDSTYNSRFLFPLAQIPYHLYMSSQNSKLTEVMTNVMYIENRCDFGDIYPLIADFDLEPLKHDDTARELSAFLKKYADKLSTSDSLFFSLLKHEGVASNVVNALIEKGIYKKPWIETEPIKISTGFLESSENPNDSVDILSSISFGNSLVSALSGNGEVAFYLEKLGVLRAINAKDMILCNAQLSISRARPLTLCSNDNGTRFAVAYENGSLEYYLASYENGDLKYAEKIETYDYFLPEYEDPVLLMGDNELYFQSDDGTLSHIINGTTETLAISPGEVSGISRVGDDVLISLRRKNDTVLSLLSGNGETTVTSCDVRSVASLPQGRATVAFSNGAVSVYDNKLSELSQIKMARPIVMLSQHDGGILGYGENSHTQLLWQYESGDVRESDMIGMFRAKGLAVTPRGLVQRNGEFLLLTQNSLYAYTISSGTRSNYAINYATVLPRGDVFFALQEGREKTWFSVSEENNGFLCNEKLNIIFKLAINGNDNVLLANPVGGGFVYTSTGKSVATADSVLAGMTSITGTGSSGFFLVDRDGDIYHLDGRRALRKAYDASGNGVSPASTYLFSYGNILICREITNDQIDGIDRELPATVLRFFETNDGKLRELGIRVFGKRDGQVSAIAFDAANDTLNIIVHIDGSIPMIYRGSVQEILQQSNSTVSMRPINIKDAFFDECLFVRDSHAVYAIDADKGIIMATLDCDVPFTSFHANGFNKRPTVLIKDERELFTLRLRKV